MEQLINFIIRPPRAEYNPKDDLLDQEFMLKGKWYQRKDLEIVNKRGDTLHCSHYKPIILPEGKSLPCVIYCHGNSGCRTDASEAAVILLPLNITVFALDFSGSGLSGGEHVTLGWNEKDDLRAVVDRLREDGDVSLIGLWGRSMGAVTSLMYGAEDPSIAGMVLDSPFSDLVDLMMELVDTYKVRVPKFTVKFVIQYMRRSIQKKANFDITDLNAVKVAKSCFVPALFGHAIDDDFIQPHHSDRIYEAYMGDKNIIKFEGDHNSPRPQFYFDSISIFFKNVLQPPEEEAGSDYFDMSNDYFNQGRWSFLHDAEVSDELLGAATRSTEDAIRQLRSRRPMSSTVVPADISSKDGQPHPQIESGKNESHPLPSNMISFEFSKGGLHSSYVPDSDDDDDEYVEYPLDSLGDFPSNVEEEERMIMKAVMESLKDLEVKTPSGVEESSSKDLKTEPKSERDDSISSVINTEPKKSNTVAAANDNSSKFEATTSSASKSSATLDAEAQEAGASSSKSVSVPGLQDADCKGQDHTDSSKTPTCELAIKPTLDEDTSDPTSSQFVPPTRQPQTEFDVADGTTVKVEVEKGSQPTLWTDFYDVWISISSGTGDLLVNGSTILILIAIYSGFLQCPVNDQK